MLKVRHVRIVMILLALLQLFAFSSCTKKTNSPAIIWTDSPAFASYAELFNSTHKDYKVIVIYKEQTARSLPPAKDETTPDLVIGSWLKNSSTRKHFTPLDYLITDRHINTSLFYPTLIEYGNMNEKQYLLPVNFNLPLIVFNTRYEELMPAENTITLEQIKDIAAAFNKKNKKQNLTAMGYGPSWDGDFLYTISKLNGASYREKGTSFNWEQEAIEKTVGFIKQWTLESNTDTETEQNFQFKYLYMPKYKQLATDKCLFAYMSSKEFFMLSKTNRENLSFRYIEKDGIQPVEDELMMMGLYKGAKNIASAEEFITWFITSNAQNEILQRTEHMDLNFTNFGIANGFSSLMTVNDSVYPEYYKRLRGKLPEHDAIKTSYILPYRWPSLKSKVIVPFLTESTYVPEAENTVIPSLEDRISDWSKQSF